MDGWPNITNPKSGSTSSRPKGGLPAPGTVVMANVEEDLGEGRYSLRWGNNRIAVNSRSPLKTGQSLILKSETNAEGKLTLVVQGQALPDPGSITGKVIYGPGKSGGKSQVQDTDGQADKYKPAESGAGGTQASGAQIAAGVAKVSVQAPQQMQTMVGLVLEPLPELQSSMKVLAEALEEEKEKLKEQEEEKKAEEENAEENGDAPENEASADKAKKRPVFTRPAVVVPHPGRAGGQQATPLPGMPVQQPSQPGQQPAQSAPPSQSVQPAQPLPGQAAPSSPPPSAPAAERPAANLVEGGPVVPEGGREADGTPPRADQPARQENIPENNREPVRPPPSGVQTPAEGSSAARPSPVVPQAVPPGAGQVVEIVSPNPLPGMPQGQTNPPPAAPGQTQPATPQPLPSHAGPAVPEGAEAPVGSGPATPSQPPRDVASNSPAAPVAPDPGRPVQAQPLPAGVGPIVPESGGAVQIPQVPVAAGEVRPSQPPVVPQAPGGAVQIPQVPAVAGEVRPSQPPVVPQAPGGAVSGSDGSVQARPLPAGVGPFVPEGGGAVQVPQVPPKAGESQPSPSPAAPQPQHPAVPEGGASVPQPSVPPGQAGGSALQIPPGQPQAIPAPVPGPSASGGGSSVQTLPASPQPALPPEAGPVVPDIPASSSSSSSGGGTDNTSSLKGEPVSPGTEPAPRPDRQNAPAATADVPRPDGAPAPQDRARPDIKPEVYLKEALTQMVKAAEIPLGNQADASRLAVGGSMPDAVVDKAAGIFLRAAGLSPDEATLAAARALVKANVQVDRDTVQAMIAATAEIPDSEREAMLKAAARLAAKDIPVSPPLIAGLADVMSRQGGGARQLMRNVVEALPVETAPPEAQPLLQGARDLLDMLHVDLGRADAASALERYVSTFGRETLGKVLSLIEVSTQAVLENNPALQAVDEALGNILSLLEESMSAEAEKNAPQQAEQPQTKPAPAPEQPPSPPPQAAPLPARPVPGSRINAYLNSPRALPIQEMLKNLPPMPKLVHIGDPVPQQTPQQTPVAAAPLPAQAVSPAGQVAPIPGQAQPPVPPPQPAMPEAGQQQAQQTQPSPPAQPQQALPREGQIPWVDANARGSALLMKLDALFQTPGLNREEFELLKPSGFLDRFLNSATDGRQDAARIKSEADALFRQLTSGNREHVEKALGELPRKEAEVLRETAAQLSKHEQSLMRNDPLLGKLSDAAGSLKDLGRQLLAVKAENLAGQDREPGVMLAEVPFKLNQDAGEGRMQMFYRRGKGKGDSWTSRVILDLNTTRMGPVLGDMRFFGQDMILNVFVDRQETADYLARETEELVDALWGKGFRAKTKFMVLPPVAAPQIRAERPEIAGEETTADTVRSGTEVRRLDIKG